MILMDSRRVARGAGRCYLDLTRMYCRGALHCRAWSHGQCVTSREKHLKLMPFNSRTAVFLRALARTRQLKDSAPSSLRRLLGNMFLVPCTSTSNLASSMRSARGRTAVSFTRKP